jgi:uncharacterized lipoprotein YmbA
MDKPTALRNRQFDSNYRDYNCKRDLEFEAATDATGYWFAAAVVFACLAAGVIVYRTSNTDVLTAANDIPAAATSTMHAHVEGVDP